MCVQCTKLVQSTGTMEILLKDHRSLNKGRLKYNYNIKIKIGINYAQIMFVINLYQQSAGTLEMLLKGHRSLNKGRLKI